MPPEMLVTEVPGEHAALDRVPELRRERPALKKRVWNGWFVGIVTVGGIAAAERGVAWPVFHVHQTACLAANDVELVYPPVERITSAIELDRALRPAQRAGGDWCTFAPLRCHGRSFVRDGRPKQIAQC